MTRTPGLCSWSCGCSSYKVLVQQHGMRRTPRHSSPTRSRPPSSWWPPRRFSCCTPSFSATSRKESSRGQSKGDESQRVSSSDSQYRPGGGAALAECLHGGCAHGLVEHRPPIRELRETAHV